MAEPEFGGSELDTEAYRPEQRPEGERRAELLSTYGANNQYAPQTAPQQAQPQWMQGNPAWLQQYQQEHGGQAPDPHAALQQYYQAVARAQLSPAEELRSQRLQRAMDGVQEQVDNGIITAGEGRQLSSQIQQMNLPLQVRRSELPLLQFRLQMHQQMMQQAHVMAMQHEEAAFRARTAQSRLSTLTNPQTGETMQMFEDRPGHHQPIQWGDAHAGQQQQRQVQQYQQQLRQQLQHFEGVARQELRHWEQERRTNPNAPGPDWYGERGPERNDEGAVRRYAMERAHQRMRELGIQAPTQPQVHAQPQTAPSQSAPIGSAAPQPATQPTVQPTPQPASTPGRPDFTAMRQAIERDPNLEPMTTLFGQHSGQQTGLLRLVNNLERTHRRYGSVDAMPPDVRARYVRTVGAVQNRARGGGVMDSFRALLNPSQRPGQLLTGEE